jgi:hypothetical protein
MIGSKASLWIEGPLLWLCLFVVVPSIAFAIGYYVWMGNRQGICRSEAGAQIMLHHPLSRREAVCFCSGVCTPAERVHELVQPS